MSLKQKLDGFIGSDYGKPGGLKGLIAGHLMFYQHRPENLWAVSLLDVQPGDQILEIGFGPGRALGQIARQLVNGRVSGLDLSATMVAQARRRNAAAVRRGIMDLRVGDASHLPFADAAFDKVLSIHSWYFWPEKVKAAGEAWRVLKPGGSFVLTFMPSDLWPGAIDGYAGEYTEEKALEMLRSGGFETIKTERLSGKFVALIGTK